MSSRPIALSTLLSALLCVALSVPDAAALSGRRCRQTCGEKILASCDGLGRRAFTVCRRNLIRTCRRDGAAACQNGPTSTTTTTTLPPVCQSDETRCGGYCCPATAPVCGRGGDEWCCPVDFPVYCGGNGRYCCQDGFVCGVTERRCQRP